MRSTNLTLSVFELSKLVVNKRITMDYLTTTTELLINAVKEITEGLLDKRLQDRAKCYMKMDFKVIEQDEFFSIQITKFKSDIPNLKFLLTDALKSLLYSQTLSQNVTVALVEQKSIKNIEVKRVICSRNTSLSLVTDSSLESQKELSSSKCYTSIRLLFHVQTIYVQEFLTSLLCFVMQIEQIDPNIKFSIRQGIEYIYRNHVPMDDIIISCKVLTSSCTSIFQNSPNDDFRKNLMDLLGIKKPRHFEETVGCLLISQVNDNFNEPLINSEKKLESS